MIQFVYNQVLRELFFGTSILMRRISWSGFIFMLVFPVFVIRKERRQFQDFPGESVITLSLRFLCHYLTIVTTVNHRDHVFIPVQFALFFKQSLLPSLALSFNSSA